MCIMSTIVILILILIVIHIELSLFHCSNTIPIFPSGAFRTGHLVLRRPQIMTWALGYLASHGYVNDVCSVHHSLRIELKSS